MWSALVSLFLGLAQAQVPEERVEVPAQLRQPALPLPSSVRDALRGRKWSEALTALQGMDERQLVGPQRADRAGVVGEGAGHVRSIPPITPRARRGACAAGPGVGNDG